MCEFFWLESVDLQGSELILNMKLLLPRRSFCFLILIAFQFLTAGACADSAKAKLEKNHRLWKSKGIANYRYTLKLQCYCPLQYLGPNVIEVRNGRAESVTYAGESKNLDMKDVKLPDTMEKLFEIARGASEESVVYDPTYGFPTSIRKFGPKGTQDTSSFYSVRGFEVMK